MNAGEHNGQEEPQQETKIGDILERRRLERGLSLKDVEQATKIRTRYLEGLEREDYGLLPDAVYVQGFLKTYANFLGLDGERLSREFKDRRAPRRLRQLSGYEPPSGTSEFERPLVSPGGLSGGGGRRRIPGRLVLAAALAVLALAAVIAVLYIIGSRSAGGPAPNEEAGGPQNGAPAETSAAGGSATHPAGGGATNQGTSAQGTTVQGTTAAGPFRATVRVTGSSSGLDVSTDGTLSYSQVAQPGFSQTFEASNAVTVSARNGGAVSVEANGQSSVPLGNSGQPATRTFSRQQ